MDRRTNARRWPIFVPHSPVPPVTRLVNTDRFEVHGIPRYSVIQTDLRALGTATDLWQKPELLYRSRNTSELLLGIASDLAKMHSEFIYIYDDALTPWVLVSDGSRSLRRMVVDVAGTAFASDKACGQACYDNFRNVRSLVCSEEHDSAFRGRI